MMAHVLRLVVPLLPVLPVPLRLTKEYSDEMASTAPMPAVG